MFFPLVAFVAAAPLLVASSPASSPSILARTFDVIPVNASKLAYDPDTGVISVFDKRGGFMGTFPSRYSIVFQLLIDTFKGTTFQST